VPAASAYSGISRRRLWALIADKSLPAIRVKGTRRVLIDRDDLDRLLEASKARPAAVEEGG
jgi:excisionase family DNA binding protein